MSKHWIEFDYARYAETGPRDLITGMRFDGAVMARLDSGDEVPAYFFTRLIGGFSPQLGKVTHWRHIQESDCARLRTLSAIARVPSENVVER